MFLDEYIFWEAYGYARDGYKERAKEYYEKYLEDLTDLRPGDTLLFGNHYLPEGGKPLEYKVKAPIRWQVLDSNNERLFVISETILDWEGFWAFNKDIKPENADAPWRCSGARSFCNGHYIKEWFTDPERNLIAETLLNTSPGPVSGQRYTVPAESCPAKLFLLSFEELLRYFDYGEFDKSRVAEEHDDMIYKMNSDKAAALLPQFEKNYEGEGYNVDLYPQYWWLRTPGVNTGEEYFVNIMAVEPGGDVCLSGMESGADEVGIRPAMYLRLDAGFDEIFTTVQDDLL